jgi:inorganic pyrophosphatase
LIENQYPLLSKHIRVDMSGYEDRREAEERIQEKIRKAQED